MSTVYTSPRLTCRNRKAFISARLRRQRGRCLAGRLHSNLQVELHTIKTYTFVHSFGLQTTNIVDNWLVTSLMTGFSF